jgi:hypothetical protein
MKKSTKSIKSAAPQTKSSEPKIVEPKPAKKTAAPRKKVTAAIPAPASAAPASIAAAKPPSVVTSPIESISVGETTITAKINVGFGNALFIRGSGPLSWNNGLLLDCVADDKWSITVGALTEPLSFKFLLNDETWSAGPDFVVGPGQSVTVVPVF